MSLTIALCTPPLKPGAVTFNTKNIISCISKAKKADIIVFPRLAVSGATCRDMFGFKLLTDGAKAAIDGISSDKIVVLGLPVVKDDGVYDGTAIIKDGKCEIFTMPKGISDEVAGIKYGTDVIPPLTIEGITVRIAPSIEGFDGLVVVPASLPEYVGTKAELVSKVEAVPAAAVVSSGAGEAVSGKIMSGLKLVGVSGKLEALGGYDEEMVLAKVGKIKGGLTTAIARRELSLSPRSESECEEIYELMGRGIVGRMNEIGTDKVILGLSGGLDSANVLLSCVLAFEKHKIARSNIICVTMQGESSSRRTQTNSAALIDAYKVSGLNVPIDSAIAMHMRAISHAQKDVVYENAQARERTQILLDLGNKFNALVLGTGDLSEICLGWSTFGGDQLSQYNPNCSLTKTAIRKLLGWYTSTKHNKVAAKIIADILDTPVSPELLSGQETEKLLGPYEVHDYYIEQLISRRLSPSEALEGAKRKFDYSADELKRYLTTLLNRLFKYQFKRNFGPDGVKLFPYDLYSLNIGSDFSPELWLEDIK